MRKAILFAVLLAWAASPPGHAGLGDGADDPAAKELLQKGDLRYDLREVKEALDIYGNVINRYPSSRYRYAAHLRLGRHYFKQGDYDRAISHLYQSAEQSPDPDVVAESLFTIGNCLFEKKEYSKAFSELRKVTSRFPGTEFSNRAFLLIGKGHFQLNDYKRAIEAFRMVGTSIPKDDAYTRKLTPGSRYYVRVEDADLRVLARQHKSINVVVTAAGGDRETLTLQPIGAEGKEFVGSLPTVLGAAKPGDKILEVVGSDEIRVSYEDSHTSTRQRDVERAHAVRMACDARVDFVDGIYVNTVQQVNLDLNANLRVIDYDRDLTDKADAVQVAVRAVREIPATKEDEVAAALEGRKLEKKYDVRDELAVTLRERPDDNKGFHSGIFTGSVEVRQGPPLKGDDKLQAEIGDVIEIEYSDDVRLSSEKPEKVSALAGLAKGQVGQTRPVSSVIHDERLRVRTELRVAAALVEMGRIYKDLGLWVRAMQKFDEALAECGKVAKTEGASDRKLLEQCQFLLWQIYFQKDQPERAATICLNLIQNFPNSEYVDQALMAMGQSAEAKGDHSQAIGLYQRLLQVKKSPLLPDAQFAVARCYEEMGSKNPHYYERALQEYQACAEKYPDSKFAPDAIVKIANFYYELKDYTRAIEIYEKTLRDYPDAKFVDLILLNYGKCLFMMKDYAAAAERFERLVSDYPESQHVERARKYALYARSRAAASSGQPPATEKMPDAEKPGGAEKTAEPAQPRE